MMAIGRLSMLRLARTPRAWIAIGAWALLAIGVAIVLRAGDPSSATDRFLLDLYAPLVLPLLSMAIVSGMAGPEGIRTLVRSVMPFGARGSSAAIATVASSAIACAVACALVAVLGVALARGNGADLRIALWVGALGGATHAAFFSLGGAIGPKGSGRGVFLFASWFLANGGTAGAALSPYAQVRSLLGGPRAGELSQRSSTLVLLALFAACTLLTAWRCRKRS